LRCRRLRSMLSERQAIRARVGRLLGTKECVIDVVAGSTSASIWRCRRPPAAGLRGDALLRHARARRRQRHARRPGKNLPRAGRVLATFFLALLHNSTTPQQTITMALALRTAARVLPVKQVSFFCCVPALDCVSAPGSSSAPSSSSHARPPLSIPPIPQSHHRRAASSPSAASRARPCSRAASRPRRPSRPPTPTRRRQASSNDERPAGFVFPARTDGGGRQRSIHHSSRLPTNAPPTS